MSKYHSINPADVVSDNEGSAGADSNSAGRGKELGRRRSWSTEEKFAIIAESEQPGETVTSVAQRHEISGYQLLDWIERAKAGTLGVRGGGQRRTPASDAVAEGGFIELGVFSRQEVNEVLGYGGPMEIELPNGLRVRLPVTTPAAMLTQALRALQAV